MKKLVSLLLVSVMILLTVAATAEEFSLRNGIQFGDTMDDVLAKETLTFDTDNTSEAWWYPYHMVIGEVELGDYFKTEGECFFDAIEYYFDDNRTLREVVYELPIRENDEGAAKSDYESLCNSLVSEYGAAWESSDGNPYPFLGVTLQNAQSTVGLYRLIGSPAYVCAYSEWVLDLDEGHVKIEIVTYELQFDTTEQYITWLGYAYFTDDDLAAAQAENQ